MLITDLPTVHVIKLTIGGRPAYLAKPKSQWDGSWFTRDLGTARRYRLKNRAEAVIRSYEWPGDYAATTEELVNGGL